MLRILVQHTGKVVTQKILRSELWDELVDAQYLRVYVRQLRRKIEVDPERPRFVLTETGVEAGQEFASPSKLQKLLANTGRYCVKESVPSITRAAR